jgi:hypothetical protein
MSNHSPPDRLPSKGAWKPALNGGGIALNNKKLTLAVLHLALGFAALTLPASADPRDASAATIAARQKYFGPENVDPRRGDVRDDVVIFSWTTNATLAVSIKGRIILLDTYINRPELPPAPGAPDLRRSPLTPQELVDLHPEAIFLGHGHGDHADNAAYIAKWLNIPIYSSPETCDAMQVDVNRMFNDPNTVNGGVRIIPDANPVACIPVVSRASVPGAEVVHLKQLEPLACIVAFKHIHSGTVPTDPNFPFVAVNPDSDSREQSLYPRQTSLIPDPTTPVPGQMNLRTSGGVGGPISLFYQFIIRQDNNFTFIWHNTTGPLKEGAGSDPGLPSPAVGAHLFAIMESLPATDVEFGSIVSLGQATNGVRDPILYQQHIAPKVYVPIHETDATPLGSSLRFKIAYEKAILTSNAPVRPEARWMVDPDDFLKPMVYDPRDDRWKKHQDERIVNQFCSQ